MFVDASGSPCSDEGPTAGTGPLPFCTLPAALASPTVGSGTTISLRGTFPGGVDVTKSGITIQGNFALIRGGAYGMSISGQHDVHVDHLRFGGQAGEAVRVDASSGIALSHISASGSQIGAATPDTTLPAIRLTGVTGASITAGSIHNNGGPGLAVQGSSQVVVSGTVVAANGGGGIRLTDTATADVVSDTVDENCGAGIAVLGVSTDVNLANTIDSNARTCGAVAGAALVVDVSGAGTWPTVDSNILTATPGADTIVLQGGPIPDGPSFDAAGHGTHDLSVDPGFASALAAGSFLRADFGLAPTSPAIDSGDSGARDEPARDAVGNPPVDDPHVADTGSGPIGYADRGTLEYTRYAAPNPTITATTGTTPATYRTVSVDVTGDGGAWWPIVSYSVDFGDGSSTGTLPYPATAPLPTHAYTEDKTYEGTVTTTDSQGNTSKKGFSVAVAKRVWPLPTLLLWEGGSVYGPSGEVTAEVQAPAADPCLGSISADFGDGSPAEMWIYAPGYGCSDTTVTHPYTKPGTYTVTVTATDKDGWPAAGPLVKQITVYGPPTPVPPPTTPPTTPAPSSPTVHRIGGTDRYETARLVSQAQWKPGSASAVVLARGDQAPDALSGVPLAAHVHGPLLLTDPEALDAATRAEIDRATGGPGPSKTVYILGGDKAVSPGVEAGLRKAGYTVVRYQGADRYRTSLAVAGAFGGTSHVIVATGRDFPDALAAGPLGAVENAPIVLSDGDTLDPAVAGFVWSHQNIDPVGGAAQRAVAKIYTTGRIVSHDLAGPTRYETAAAVSDVIARVTGHAPTGLGVASGESFPDALTGGAYAANAGMPLLITEPDTLAEPSRVRLAQWANTLSAVTVFGGPKAVADTVVSSVAAAVKGKVQ
ncbi:hypothetical protein GCM10009838_68770 [Catenulispora subtropica]|uniref:PKD domain-containing protein n=1 Tax=Catenulispora subtropica TaxID=450798 RepID=A0ABN2T029_9ACTN